MNKKLNQVLAVVLTIVALMTGQVAMAENGWDISASTSGSTTTFTITRTNTAVAETVKYRFVSLSAYAGQHYNVTQVNGQSSSALSGELTFTAGDNTSRTIQVTESTGSGAYSYYKDATQRSYKLEVTDAGGFKLTSNTRSFTTGTSINSSNVYAEKSVTVNSGTITVTDGGFTQAYHAVSIADYYTAAAPKAYLLAAGAELRMKVELEEAEHEDGYQHIQLLVNQTSNCDNSANKGNPGTPSYSRYLASFAHKPGSTLTTYAKVCFPLTSASDGCGEIDQAWNFSPYNNTYGKLYTQNFKSGYRADDGKLIIAKKDELNGLNYVGIRFDASGDNSDTWYAKNTIAKIQAEDVTAPTKSAISVAPGRHSKGNTVYVSVAFNEIVTVSGTPKLTTNNSWGDISYVAGSGTNVLTFSKTIPANASGNLNIMGLSGTVEDLAGNDLVGSGVTASGICSLDASYAYTITYDLDEGSVATENPTTYTWETATITLNNPTKIGYIFNGWTGSNGDTPQTTVTIANNSHGNKSYTANWTQVWTGNGTQGAPYTITSTQGLDWLAQYVNSGNNCSGLFFQLGGPITYTHTTDWNNENSEENNYTAIGNDGHPFQGTFDGQGYTVSGIRIYKSGDRHLGLFGLVENGGTVRNVNLADARITGYRNVGGIVGNALTNTTVEDCTVGANVCFHTVQSNAMYHGGIVGYSSGSVFRCISRATLTIADNLTNLSYYGGIAGHHSIGNLTDCIAEGVVIPAVSSRGAILGSNSGSYSRNYYRSCTVAGVANATGVGCNGADTYGARALYAVTLGPNVTISRNVSATLPGTGNKTYTNGADIAGVPYAYASSYLNFSYNSANIPAGYNLTVSAAETTSGTTVDLTDNGGYTYSLSMPAADVTVSATFHTTVTYIDVDGNTQSHLCIPVLGDTNIYGNSGNAQGWYCVDSDVTINGTQGVQFLDQAVHIILCDGATLTSNVTNGTNAAIEATNGPLTIYGQSQGTGKLVTSSRGHGIYVNGNVNFYGGTINSTSSSNRGILCHNGNATILRGSVTAQGSSYGIYCSKASISGGIVIAEGSSSAIYAFNNLNIIGGTVTAHCTGTSEDRSGLFSYSGNINILGGIVTATGPAGIQAGITGGYGLKTITLGYTSTTDCITASSYVCATLNVTTGQTLTDGTANYTGTLNSDQKNDISGNTLVGVPSNLAINANQNGSDYWTTFYFGGVSYKIDEGEDATAYTATRNDNTLTLTSIGKNIPKNIAVIIKGTDNSISLTRDDNITDYSGSNVLQGVNAETAQDANKTYYVLSKPAGKELGFFKLAKQNSNSEPIKLGAHKAYLEVASVNNAPAFFGFGGSGENTTAINEHESHQSHEFTGDYYTLDGRKLQGKPTQKGIYVRNGRKIIIK